MRERGEMFAKPRIGIPTIVVAVFFAYALLVMVRAVTGVPIPMWAFPIALALVGAASYVGAGLGTAAREKAAGSSE